MDGKSRILIVSFLGRIQVASKKKHKKAGGRAVIHYLMGWNGAVKGMVVGRILPRPYESRKPAFPYFFSDVTSMRPRRLAIKIFVFLSMRKKAPLMPCVACNLYAEH